MIWKPVLIWMLMVRQLLQFVCIFFLMDIDVYVSFFCNVQCIFYFKSMATGYS